MKREYAETGTAVLQKTEQHLLLRIHKSELEGRQAKQGLLKIKSELLLREHNITFGTILADDVRRFSVIRMTLNAANHIVVFGRGIKASGNYYTNESILDYTKLKIEGRDKDWQKRNHHAKRKI